MTRLLKLLNNARNNFSNYLITHAHLVSAETLGWCAVILIHSATIPTLLALLAGLSDHTPGIDVVLFMWAGLCLLFGRAIVLRDTLNIVTIGTGFIIQAVIMALILFK
jgi:hypothetical protein